MKVFSLACPLFVPLAEEGYIDRKATYLIAQDYLQTMIDVEVDTLVLGCTHYPLLKDVIQSVVGDKVTLIGSGEETAKVAFQAIKKAGLLKYGDTDIEGPDGYRKFYVTDVPEKFSQVAARFLGQPIGEVEHLHELRTNADLAAGAFQGRQPIQRAIDATAQLRLAATCSRKQRHNPAFPLFQQH